MEPNRKITKTISMYPHDIAKLQVYADTLGVSFSRLIEMCIQKSIPRLEVGKPVSLDELK